MSGLYYGGHGTRPRIRTRMLWRPKPRGRDTIQNSNANTVAATARASPCPGHNPEFEGAYYGGRSPCQPTAATRPSIRMRILWRPQPATAYGKDTAQSSTVQTTTATARANPRVNPRLGHGRKSNACTMAATACACACPWPGHGPEFERKYYGGHSPRQPTAGTLPRTRTHI